MKHFFFARLLCFGILAGLLTTLGCGKKLPPMAPVSGKVTVNGQPLTAGNVSFIPDVKIDKSAKGQKDTAPAGLSASTVGSDGTYKIITGGKDGAPLGKYKVTVNPSMVPVADAKAPPPTGFNQQFTNPKTTPLHVEVIANPESGRYDLKLTK